MKRPGVGGRPKKVFESSDDDDIYWSDHINMPPSSLRTIGCSVSSQNVLSFKFLYVDVDGGHAEPREKDLEAIADVLNDFQFAVPVPPRRISSRVKKVPVRYSDEQVEEKINTFSAMTKNCKHYKHKGVGCAAASADHFPEYFNSLDNVLFSRKIIFAFSNSFQS